MLKLYDKMFIAYGSVINAVGIVFCHLLYFTWESAYIQLSPYLSTVFGVQLIKAVSDLRFSYKFHFCNVTRFNNWCYLLICVVYMIFYPLGVPDVYTIIVQTILAFIGLFSFTFMYTKKYPKCWISMYLKAKKKSVVIFGIFAKTFVVSGFDCDKALDEFQKKRYNNHLRNENL